jgi:hypothetical protein
MRGIDAAAGGRYFVASLREFHNHRTTRYVRVNSV